jgi:dihydrofolate synthase/folylpolyglutamate synthase
MRSDIDSVLEKYNRARESLLSLITDPAGSRYHQVKSREVRLIEFQEQIDRISDFLDFAGNPQAQYRSIHIAGTSGKGSVVYMIAAILSAAGVRTGFHISPYLQVCNEKLIIDGKMISPSAFVHQVNEFWEIYENWINSGGKYPSLKYGEAWVALTYLWMARSQAEWAVIETGLGGRYDPTNVLPSVMQVITNVDYDHVETLGPELTHIAEHKAGIIKPDGLVVTTTQKPELLSIIRREARHKRATLFSLGEDFDFKVLEGGSEKLRISVQTPYRNYEEVEISMQGSFQPVNAALSVASVDVLSDRFDLSISDEDIRMGLKNLVFPGRMEIVQDKPLVLLDGAHNGHKMAALKESLSTMYPEENLIAVVGMLSTKDFKAMIDHLVPITSRWVVTQPHVFGKPSTQPSEIESYIKNINPKADIRAFDYINDALDVVLAEASQKDLIVVTGSLYLVGEARERWFPTREILSRLELTG